MVADQRSPRDGRFIENIGQYHPLEDPSLIEIDQDRALHWLRVGAQPSDQVRNLMEKVGIWDAFVAERPKAAAGLSTKGESPAKAEDVEEGAGQGRRGRRGPARSRAPKLQPQLRPMPRRQPEPAGRVVEAKAERRPRPDADDTPEA